MTAYYNEIDPFAAQWLRELIVAGHIAPGDVDERSIEDVVPSELVGFNQCHFFAGIGVWSYALRQAGWPDDRPIWTGSCPCQPFSAAGKGGGTSDERHLWPAFEWLIRQCRPDCILGEQVESAIKHDWLDHVALSLESIGYAVGSVGFPACSTGAPYIRQRLYWCADLLAESKGYRSECEVASPREGGWRSAESALRSPTRRVADAEQQGNGTVTGSVGEGERIPQVEGSESSGINGICGNAGVLGDSEGKDGSLLLQPRRSRQSGAELGRPSPTNGFWANAEWLPCRDGKARPVEPGTFPLVNGAAARVVHSGDQGAPDAEIDPQNTAEARVGRLRGYGNAITAPQAEAFIRAVMGEI